MIDRFLKFANQEEAESVLFDKTDDGYLTPKGNFSADLIGVIYKETGETIDSPGGPLPVMAALPGCHVNVRGVGNDDFIEYEVTVATPVRSWS